MTGDNQRILFPTDFSEASNYAFEYAEKLAAKTGADLVVLHVFDVPDYWGTGGSPKEVEADIKQQLKDIAVSNPDIGVEHYAHGGPPGEVICWVAQEKECDQIVMGTHGHTGLLHLLMGSVAEYVVRNARCPVVTVRQRPTDEAPLKEPVAYQPMPPIL